MIVQLVQFDTSKKNKPYNFVMDFFLEIEKLKDYIFIFNRWRIKIVN